MLKVNDIVKYKGRVVGDTNCGLRVGRSYRVNGVWRWIGSTHKFYYSLSTVKTGKELDVVAVAKELELIESSQE